MISKLDNPVWNALSETHAQFCEDFSEYKFYNSDYSIFGAGVGPLPEMPNYKSSFFVVGEKPEFEDIFTLQGSVLCDQMVMKNSADFEFSEEIIRLNNTHEQELFDLVNLVQPGYFMSGTAELGDYFGIFKEGKLAAVTGERMKMEGFTEISAVVAHPDHHRKGYAKQLVVYTAQKILNEGNIPFLHVAEQNSNAIGLYERLGFEFRRKMNFWKISKK